MGEIQLQWSTPSTGSFSHLTERSCCSFPAANPGRERFYNSVVFVFFSFPLSMSCFIVLYLQETAILSAVKGTDISLYHKLRMCNNIENLSNIHTKKIFTSSRYCSTITLSGWEFIWICRFVGRRQEPLSSFLPLRIKCLKSRVWSQNEAQRVTLHSTVRQWDINIPFLITAWTMLVLTNIAYI